MPQALSEFLAYETCQEVIATTRSKANDNANGSRRIGWIGLSQHRQASPPKRTDHRKTHHNAAPCRLLLAWHASSRVSVKRPAPLSPTTSAVKMGT